MRADDAPPTYGPWRLAWNTATSDHISVVSAGCAFYAMLALFPALSLCISIYGMMFDPTTVEPQLVLLERLMPAESSALIAARIHQLVAAPPGRIELGAIIGGAIALWSASSGIRAMLSALNLAQDKPEERGPIAFNVTALLLTFGAILAVILGLALLVILPSILDLFGLEPFRALLYRAAGLAIMMAWVLVAIGLLYRFGPARRPEGWRFLSIGALSATLLWAFASALFSLYVSHVATYDATYGPLGAVVALLMWFYVSAYVILLGAELDAAIARNRATEHPSGTG
jgi:membrane protein